MTKEYYIWDTSKTQSQHVATLVAELSTHYYGVPLGAPPDVRNW